MAAIIGDDALLNQKFLQAAISGNIEKVQKALENGANPFTKNTDGQTATDLCLANGHKDIAACIITFTIDYYRTADNLINIATLSQENRNFLNKIFFPLYNLHVSKSGESNVGMADITNEEEERSILSGIFGGRSSVLKRMNPKTPHQAAEPENRQVAGETKDEPSGKRRNDVLPVASDVPSMKRRKSVVHTATEAGEAPHGTTDASPQPSGELTGATQAGRASSNKR